MLQVFDSSNSSISIAENRLPAMIHVGFAKAASTYLQSFLRQHPEVFLVFKSNYFTPFPRPSVSAKEYAKYFNHDLRNSVAVESDEHIIMPLFHPTLGLRALTRSSTDQVIDMLSSIVPETKILLIVRNHMDMLTSTYSQYLLGGGTLSIDDFVRRLLEEQDDGQEYFAAYFAEIIDKFRQRFANRVLTLLLCDFQQDSQK